MLSALGPAPSIAEAFAYLGAAFVLSAWCVLVPSRFVEAGAAWQVWTVATALVAAVSTVAGLVIRGRGPRASRAAGVLFAVATANVGAAIFNLLDPIVSQEPERLVVAASAAVAAAALLRRTHAALLTQAAVIVALVAAAAAVSAWTSLTGTTEEIALDLVIWAIAAVVLGVLASLEHRAADVDAVRRVGLTRFGAA